MIRFRTAKRLILLRFPFSPSIGHSAKMMICAESVESKESWSLRRATPASPHQRKRYAASFRRRTKEPWTSRRSSGLAVREQLPRNPIGSA
jgi:hypothetical protein